MSEIPKTVEDTAAPATEPTPVVEATEAAKPSEATAESEPSATAKPNEAEAAAVGDEAVPAPPKEETPPKDSKATVEATPATEGTLGYKASGFIPKFRFHEHYFWFDDAPSTPESLNSYVRTKDLKSAHPNAAWAQETGKGLLFYAKRAEDKSTPAGIINLSEATNVLIEGMEEFFFKAHGDKHTFKAKNSEERSSWVATLGKKIEEAKAMKDEIQASEGYKKRMESFAKTPALAAATTATSTSREPAKSLDSATATNGGNKNAADVDGTTEEKKEKDAKSRSQSRKRSSIFGALLGKKEEKDEQKEVKKEEKVEKEEGKEEKKEEAKATHEPETAAEAAVTGAGAADAAIAAEEKKDDKHESETTPVTEKKPKRASIFGSLFSKKDATSPTSEKAEKEAGPSVPAKDAEVLPVSDTAPKIEEPIANKPIDTAAVTAPIDTIETPAAVDEAPTETAKETAPAETATTPTKEKKGSVIMGFIKKEAARFEGKKEAKKDETAEKKDEEAAENVSKDPVTATATTESPANAEEAAAPATEEAKPNDNKRRSSLFNLSGTIKKRTQNTESTDAEAIEPGTKREKSPLPQRIGSLFRRPSRGVKSEESKEATAASTDSAPAAQAAPASKGETAVAAGSSAEAPNSAIVGDVPEALHTNFQGAPEVKAPA